MEVEVVSSQDLDELEARLESSLTVAFVLAGDSLRAIREGKLYKRRGYSTFEDYCETRWQLSRSYAHRLIDASSVHDILLPTGNILPAGEWTTRPLVRLLPDSEAVTGAWNEAVETAPIVNEKPSITAKHVERVVKRWTDSEPEEPAPENTCTVDDLTALAEAGQRFGTIYADPPWQYGNQATRASTDNHYETMTVDEICALPVEPLAAERAHLHLWTTNAFLFDAKRVIEAWGFEYRSCFVWCKPQMGIGNYWRVSHEFLLLGVRGDAVTFQDKTLMSWESIERGQHSKKPEAVRRKIEAASMTPRLELFARETTEGWAAWGDQVERTLLTLDAECV
jgi:N6-adenosine-specific RNA methylase IME4